MSILWMSVRILCPVLSLTGALVALEKHGAGAAIFWTGGAALFFWMFLQVDRTLIRVKRGPRYAVRTRLASFGTTLTILVLFLCVAATLSAVGGDDHALFVYLQIAITVLAVTGIWARILTVGRAVRPGREA